MRNALVGCVLALVACTRANTGPCPCSADSVPVCGDDGVTYANACFAGCQGATVARAGACPQPRAEDCRSCNDYSLVCGANGITYASECLAECNQTTVASDGACPYTPHPGSRACETDADCIPVSGTCGFEACFNKADPPSRPPPCVGCPQPGCASAPSPGCYCENKQCASRTLELGAACNRERDLCAQGWGQEVKCCDGASGATCTLVEASSGACP